MTDSDTVRVTYAELARARGVSIGAARRMALRHRWPKQVSNDGLSRIAVPMTFLTRPDPVDTDVVQDVMPDVANRVSQDVGRNVSTDTAGLQVVAVGEALAAFAEVAKNVTIDVARDVVKDVVKDTIVILRDQLVTERERADRAEERVRERDARITELQTKLETERTEHRQIVALLAARRSWWPFRRSRR